MFHSDPSNQSFQRFNPREISCSNYLDYPFPKACWLRTERFYSRREISKEEELERRKTYFERGMWNFWRDTTWRGRNRGKERERAFSLGKKFWKRNFEISDVTRREEEIERKTFQKGDVKFLTTWWGRNRAKPKKKERDFILKRKFRKRKNFFKRGMCNFWRVTTWRGRSRGLLVLGKISKERGKLFFKRGTWNFWPVTTWRGRNRTFSLGGNFEREGKTFFQKGDVKFLTWRGRSIENAKKERRLLLPGRNFKRGGVERRKPFSKGGREISDDVTRKKKSEG